MSVLLLSRWLIKPTLLISTFVPVAAATEGGKYYWLLRIMSTEKQDKLLYLKFFKGLLFLLRSLLCVLIGQFVQLHKNYWMKFNKIVQEDGDRAK